MSTDRDLTSANSERTFGGRRETTLSRVHVVGETAQAGAVPQLTRSPSCKSTLCALVLTFGCETQHTNPVPTQSPADKLSQVTKASVPTFVVTPSSTGGTGSQAVSDETSCSRLPFFDFYRNARLITADEPNNVRLQIHIDYHTGAGCMAPDGYGTDLIIALRLRAEDSGCFIERAQVRAVDWGLPPDPKANPPSDRKLRFDLSPFDVLEHVDLTRTDSTAVPIHSPSHGVSALIRRTGVLWYEQTRRDSVLQTRVDTQDEEKGCCWPATSTYYREYGVND